MMELAGPLMLEPCPTPGCDLAWLFDVSAPHGSPHFDIQYYWRRDIAVGPDPNACASCYWRAHYLQERHRARGLQTSPTILWADGAGGVGVEQPPPGAPLPEETWDDAAS